MLINIAWRNVWRHPLRSGVVMVAIALGLWAGLAMISFSWGISESRTRDVIQTQTSHLQIHPKQFEAGEEMKYFLKNGEQMLQEVSQLPQVVQSSGRLIASGMLESTSGNFGIQIRGVDPEQEAATTQLRDRIIGGEYFPDTRRPTILVGETLAKKIGVVEEAKETEGNDVQPGAETSGPNFNFRRNMVIRFQDPQGQIVSSRFKVAGVYEAQNANLEEMQVFMKLSDLQELIGVETGIQEIAILLNDIQQSDSTIADLKETYPDTKVEDLGDLAPELEFLSNSIDASLRIFVGIILLALAFGIINTMQMAVLERTRELGMLMSVGMNRIKVFGMILLETVFLTVAGAPIGLLASWGFVKYYGKAGIDLSAFEAGMDEFGMASIVYTELPSQYYMEVMFMVILTALVSAIFPARRALKLNPAEAVRAI